MLKIKNIITGNIFNLSDEEVKRIMSERNHNFEIVDDSKEAKALKEEFAEKEIVDTPISAKVMAKKGKKA